jgi:hypothetical protein
MADHNSIFTGAEIDDGISKARTALQPVDFTTPVTVLSSSAAPSEIRLPEDSDNGSNYLALKAPAALASNVTLTFPNTAGSAGQVLETDGSGGLSWAQASGRAGYLVANLPLPGTAGRRAYVTDAAAPAFLEPVNGSGTFTVPVFDNGTAWVVG